MSHLEYKVVPAPKKGLKAKGIKGADARFAHALEQLINDLAAEGWRYQRAETLPSEERSGLANFTTTYRNILVFSRPAISVDSRAETTPAKPTKAIEKPTEKPAIKAKPEPTTAKPGNDTGGRGDGFDDGFDDDRARLKSAFNIE